MLVLIDPADRHNKVPKIQIAQSSVLFAYSSYRSRQASNNNLMFQAEEILALKDLRSNFSFISTPSNKFQY